MSELIVRHVSETLIREIHRQFQATGDFITEPYETKRIYRAKVDGWIDFDQLARVAIEAVQHPSTNRENDR
jgi:hypothetical protein